MSQVIEDMTPLKTEYLPSQFVDRGDEAAAIKAAFSDVTETSLRNLHIYGPRGTGKTHLTRYLLRGLEDQVNTCYVQCTRHDTQYKVLKQVYQQTTQEEINTGYHVSDLQRKIEERTGAIPSVVVLDDFDFALLNDGESLLYYLSRIEDSENFGIVTISSNHRELPLEERTTSSLQSQRIEFSRYSAEQVYDILLERAEDALKPRTLQREALTYIASATPNISQGLYWLKRAAEESGDAITEETVKMAEEPAYENYVENLLEPFSTHHKQVYHAIKELFSGRDSSPIQSGTVYERYQELCKNNGEEPLSDRRISTYLKHLELLGLIESEYHYGGKTGKTREISLAASAHPQEI